MVGDKKLTLAVVLCLGLAVFLLTPLAFRPPKPPSADSLTLPDGSLLRIIAVTHGTNHVVGPPLARLAHRFPPSAQSLLMRLFGRRAIPLASSTTPRPALLIWLQDLSGRTNFASGPGYCSAFLADDSGFVSGEGGDVRIWGSTPQSLTFYATPRRDRTVWLEFYYHAGTGEAKRCGRLRLENPLYGKFLQWQPQTLPATNHAGDVEVVVQRLSTGHDSSTTHLDAGGGAKAIEFGTNRLDGRNRTICLCTFRPLTRTNEVWCLTREQVSDATGNCLDHTSLGWGGYADGYFSFEPSLWTNEAAWKLKCEIKRSRGFAPEETVVFPEVPLGRLGGTNLIGWATNLNGVTLSLDQIVRRPPHTNDSWSSDALSRLELTVTTTNGLHVDLISACTDHRTNLTCGSWDSSGRNRRYFFRTIPLDAKTADFTFSVQRSRWIEFLLKPEVGPLRLELRSENRQ